MSVVFSTLTQATLITDSSKLTGDYYQTYGGIDFAWASPVNIETWNETPTTNYLYAPDLHEGWDYATDAELNIFKDHFQLSDFKIEIEPGKFRYKHAVEFWNSYFTDVRVCSDDSSCDENNVNNLIDGKIKSEWTTGVEIELAPGFTQFIDAIDMDTATYETIYVRRNAHPVPEPTTLLIFSLGLIALSLRARFSQ